VVTIENARNAALASEFHSNATIRMGNAGSANVTDEEFDAEFSLMKFFRKLAFRMSQTLDPIARDQLRLERQERAVARFRAER